MNLSSIPAFDDNYIWALNDEAGRCLIVGPGDAEPVLNAIAASSRQPGAVFLIHRRHDHVGGVKELVKKFPQIMVYGPQGTQDRGTAQVVKDSETAFVLEHEFNVIAAPGHTLGRIYYLSKPYLFYGDALFSGGCGRLSGETPSQVYQSLKELSVLPDDTLVYCTHEYTLSNMKFALSILPHDLSINNYYHKVKELRAKNQIALPVILENERQIGIFLKTEGIDLIGVINEETLLQQPEERFTWLKLKKDRL